MKIIGRKSLGGRVYRRAESRKSREVKQFNGRTGGGVGRRNAPRNEIDSISAVLLHNWLPSIKPDAGKKQGRYEERHGEVHAFAFDGKTRQRRLAVKSISVSLPSYRRLRAFAAISWKKWQTWYFSGPFTDPLRYWLREHTSLCFSE